MTPQKPERLGAPDTVDRALAPAMQEAGQLRDKAVDWKRDEDRCGRATEADIGAHRDAEAVTIERLTWQVAANRVDIEDLKAQAVVDAQLIAKLQAEGMIDKETIAHLEAALVASRRIGTAIGILMSQMKISSDTAFAMLSTVSQAQQRKIRDLAEDVVLYGTLIDNPS